MQGAGYYAKDQVLRFIAVNFRQPREPASWFARRLSDADGAGKSWGDCADRARQTTTVKVGTPGEDHCRIIVSLRGNVSAIPRAKGKGETTPFSYTNYGTRQTTVSYIYDS